jgi:predicted restriction endonuclease
VASIRIVEQNRQRISGGHRRQTVRVRLGQGAFRKSLEERYGSTCAFTGRQPREVLEAAHLYSFAESGEHHPHGGLLLRRDLHRIYDLGLLRVDPGRMELWVDESLQRFPDYARLHGAKLAVDVSGSVVDWLRLHWEASKAS